mgnify:CR=1 FL=1
MTESSQHTSKPQVEVEVSGGDDNKSARRGAIFIGVVLVGYIVYLVVTGQMGQFWAAMSSVQMSWLLVACFCMFLYLVFGIVAYAIAVWLDPNSPVGIRDLISVEASGIFFGNLTPMMMGSTPAQIYRLTKAGQNVGEAGATQFTRFIVYQFGLVAWGAILLLARMPFFAERGLLPEGLKDEMFDYYLAFLLSGIIGIYRTWALSDGSVPIERVSAVANDLTLNGLSSLESKLG